VPPTLNIDRPYNPDINAEAYFRAVDKYGSPAPSMDEVRRSGDGPRHVFDSTLAALSGMVPVPAKTTGGTCATVNPGTEAELAPGTTARFEPTGGGAGYGLRRLATALPEEFKPTELSPTPTEFAVPRDTLPEPWRVVVFGAPVRVCQV